MKTKVEITKELELQERNRKRLSKVIDKEKVVFENRTAWNSFLIADAKVSLLKWILK